MEKNCNSCFDYKLMKNAANAIEKTSYSLNLETFGSELEEYIDTLKFYDKTHSILERTLDDFTDYTTKVKSCGSELANLYMGIQKGVEAYEEAEGKTSTFLNEFADTIEKYLGNKTVAGYLRNDKIVNKDTFATSRDDFLENISEETQLFISQYAMYMDLNCPSEYSSSDEWRKALIEKYQSLGYSSYDASDLAYAEMAKWRIGQTGAEITGTAISIFATENFEGLMDTVQEEYDDLVTKYKEEGYSEEQAKKLASLESEYNDAKNQINEVPNDNSAKIKASNARNELERLKEEYTPLETHAIDEGENSTPPAENNPDIPIEEEKSAEPVKASPSSSNSTAGSTSSNGPSNISYRVEQSEAPATTNSAPTQQQKVETPSSNTSTNNNTQQTPSDNTNTNNDTTNNNSNQSGNTTNNSDTGNNSSLEKPNTGNNTDNSSNTGNNNANTGNSNTGNGTETTPNPPVTDNNTGTNNGNENNNGIINNMPGNTETGNTNTNNGNVSYGPSNNTGTNYGSSYGNSKPTIVPSPGTGNNNAATTTPSAPDSDAGIIDNSGETLDVISIDKDSSKVQPSTSSSDGGSVIPVILGVGAAGAAAVAGAKFIHDKKERENTYTYEDDSSAENTNYSYNSNIDEQESSEDPYDAVMQPNAKYKAGNVNKLVLDDAPADINIRSDIPDNNSKEELE